MILFTINFILSSFIVVSLHESIHFVVAKILKLSPHFYVSKYGTPTVKYKNENKYFKTFLTSISAPIVVVVIAILLPESDQFNLIKLMGLLNIFNLLPITTDGEVAIYALIKLWIKTKNNI